jgi:hypothetical protein
MLHSSNKLTVLLHFYNEEWLLPHWLRHHRELFDHGILIDYASTDRSLEIIKEITPDWKVVKSRNDKFHAELCDKEMMDHEETVSGWKMVLNVTEFLFVDELKSRLKASNSDMLRFKGFQINDSEQERNLPFEDDKPIIMQRFNGFEDPWRHRIIHKRLNGGYYVGRHYQTPGLKRNPHSSHHHGDIPFGEDLYLFWYRFAPYKNQIPRKIQISDQVPQSDIDKGFGWNHWNLDEAKIEERWRETLPKMKDVRMDDGVKKMYEKLSSPKDSHHSSE